MGSGLGHHPLLWPQHVNEVLMRHEPPGPFWTLPSRSTSSWGPDSLGSHQGGCSALPIPTLCSCYLLPACKRSSPGKLHDGTFVFVGKGQLRRGLQTTAFVGVLLKQQEYSQEGRGDRRKVPGGVKCCVAPRGLVIISSDSHGHHTLAVEMLRMER